MAESDHRPIRAAVLGASGYTGADMIRLAALPSRASRSPR